MDLHQSDCFFFCNAGRLSFLANSTERKYIYSIQTPWTTVGCILGVVMATRHGDIQDNGVVKRNELNWPTGSKSINLLLYIIPLRRWSINVGS